MPRPASSGEVTDKYGPRVHPISGDPNSFHYGEDTAPPGNVFPVHGVVIFAGYYGGWGNIIGIRETANPNVRWWVAHCASIPANVKVGLWGNEGDFLAPIGSTGNSTGTHAHTERRVGGQDVPGTGEATDPREEYKDQATPATEPVPTGPTEEKENEMKLIQHTDRGIAVIGAGYFKSLTGEELPYAIQIYGMPLVYPNARQFDLARSIATNGNGDTAEVARDQATQNSINAVLAKMQEIQSTIRG